MDIRHNLGSDMTIALDSRDLEFMANNGYCMDRNGLVGHDTKTWVRTDIPCNEPNAQIDAASDVTVYLPDTGLLPVRIDNEDIDPYMDLDRGRVAHFFGKAGGIIIKASES